MFAIGSQGCAPIVFSRKYGVFRGKFAGYKLQP